MRRALGIIALGGALALAGCASSKERVTLLTPAQAGKAVGGVVVEYDNGAEAYLGNVNQQARLRGVKAPKFKQFDKVDPFYSELMAELPALAARRDFTFAFGEGTLAPDQLNALQTWLSDNIKDRPGLHIEIAAHTDAAGSEAVNDKLSQERANAVLAQVLERIEAGQIEVQRQDIDVVASSWHWARDTLARAPDQYNPASFRVVSVTVR